MPDALLTSTAVSIVAQSTYYSYIVSRQIKRPISCQAGGLLGAGHNAFAGNDFFNWSSTLTLLANFRVILHDLPVHGTCRIDIIVDRGAVKKNISQIRLITAGYLSIDPSFQMRRVYNII